MAVPGIEAYAKCSECGDISWCDESPLPQSVVCKCGALQIDDYEIVRGSNDPSFTDVEMIGFLETQ